MFAVRKLSAWVAREANVHAAHVQETLAVNDALALIALEALRMVVVLESRNDWAVHLDGAYAADDVETVVIVLRTVVAAILVEVWLSRKLLATNTAHEALGMELVAVSGKCLGRADGISAAVALRQTLAAIAAVAIGLAAAFVIALQIERTRTVVAQPMIVVVAHSTHHQMLRALGNALLAVAAVSCVVWSIRIKVHARQDGIDIIQRGASTRRGRGSS